MKNVHRAKIMVLLSLAGLSVLGCYNKDKEQIRALYRDKQILIEQKEDLARKLATSEEKHAELLTLLDSKDGQLVVSRTKIKGLEDQLAELEKQPKDPPTGTSDNGPLLRGKQPKWTMGSDVLFASGQATLTTSGRRELNRIIEQLKSRYTNLPIRVYGHTDSDPIRKSKWKDNLQLSGARAMEVRRYMVAKGIPAEDVETIAMGSSNPVASNRTRAGKQKNRRVEIVVIRK